VELFEQQLEQIETSFLEDEGEEGFDALEKLKKTSDALAGEPYVRTLSQVPISMPLLTIQQDKAIKRRTDNIEKAQKDLREWREDIRLNEKEILDCGEKIDYAYADIWD
jgi:hypothetical protein